MEDYPVRPYIVNTILKDKDGNTIKTSTNYYASEKEREDSVRNGLEVARSTLPENSTVLFLYGELKTGKRYRLEFNESHLKLFNPAEPEIQEEVVEI